MSAARKSPASPRPPLHQSIPHQHAMHNMPTKYDSQHHSWDEATTTATASGAPTVTTTINFVPSHGGSGAMKPTPTRAASSPLPYKCPKSPRNFHVQTSVPYDSTVGQLSSSSPPLPQVMATAAPRSPSARSAYSTHSNFSIGSDSNSSASMSSIGGGRMSNVGGSASGACGNVGIGMGGNSGAGGGGNARCNYYDNPPRSPKITTTYANDSADEISSSASYYQTPKSGKSSTDNSFDSPSSCGGYLVSGHMPNSPRRSPNSPRKFVFDAISPMGEQSSKKFEYYEPISPDDGGYFESNAGSVPMTAPPPLSPKIYEPRRTNSKKLPRPGGGGPLEKVVRTMGYNAMGNSSSDHNNSRNEWELPLMAPPTEAGSLSSGSFYLKRDSCVTESTQLSVESNDTNTNSTATTATTSFSYSDHNKSANPADMNHKNRESFKHSGDNVRSSSVKQRRHAINITSNPGYQVLHSSHSTLDRTCSDSVVSLRYRKSTSDLTKDTECAAVEPQSRQQSKTDISINAANSYKQRRRGSSKGGLAYLASRRSSRESMKSACSNTSIFSNDDVGPLAFQSSNRGRQRRTSNFLELPVPDHIRPRVCSLPDRPYNPRVSDDLYRLRHFSISKGNVVNCGDSIISRRSRSNTSVNSTNSRASERSPFEGSCCGGGYANVDSLPATPDDDDSDNLEPPPPPRYRIVMLGDAGVGKTALVNQFMTSEYMHTYDASLDDEFGEKTVSILLDDEESELVFIDHPSVEMSVENSLSTYEPHGCVVVFSVVDKASFRVAEEIINYLWQENYTKDKAVILVGNKADLARARLITSQDGKTLAASRDAKFIETSSGIQHNVDELLVGILKQIRLKETREKKATSSKMKTSRTHISLHLAKEILQKICLTDISKSKSCENLHVL